MHRRKCASIMQSCFILLCSLSLNSSRFFGKHTCSCATLAPLVIISVRTVPEFYWLQYVLYNILFFDLNKCVPLATALLMVTWDDSWNVWIAWDIFYFQLKLIKRTAPYLKGDLSNFLVRSLFNRFAVKTMISNLFLLLGIKLVGL